MLQKSEVELEGIVQNKEHYQKEAVSAAINELSRRSSLPEHDQLQEDSELGDFQSEPENDQAHRLNKQSIFNLLKIQKGYVITPIIIYLNVLVFILMTVIGVNPFQPSLQALVDWGGNLRSLTLDGQQFRLLTSTFLHGGLFHLLFNMYALLYVGWTLEKKYGSLLYASLYLTTGILASAASISININVVSIGASGAIFGMFGLFLAALVFKQLDIHNESRKSLISSIMFFVGYNLVFGFANTGIDNAAHVGGLLSGIMIGGLVSFTSNRKIVLSVLAGITIITTIAVTALVPNRYGQFQTVMDQFSRNELKALTWVYSSDLSNLPELMVDSYYERLQSEGIDLWEDNIKILSSLEQMPLNLRTQIRLLIEYSELRLESYKILQKKLKSNDLKHLQDLDSLNSRIDSKIQEIQTLRGF